MTVSKFITELTRIFSNTKFDKYETSDQIVWRLRNGIIISLFNKIMSGKEYIDITYPIGVPKSEVSYVFKLNKITNLELGINRNSEMKLIISTKSEYIYIPI